MTETIPTGWKRRVHGYASHPATHRALPTSPGVVWSMHPSMGGVPFITLAALDSHAEAPEQWGLHYNFVVDACYILCDSGSDSKEGFLSTDAEGRSPVPASRLLPVGQYYWHTGRPEEHAECHCNWKIVNSFQKWDFPQAQEFRDGRALAHWNLHPLAQVARTYSQDEFRNKIAERDGGCIVTGGSYGMA
jgi:hypothetical protein